MIEADSKWWEENLEIFETTPNQVLEPCRSCKQERIPAVPILLRNILISMYCRQSLQEAARASKKNEDCLIRLYTGKRRLTTRPSIFFNLRNYGICVDQMKDLGLNIKAVAKILAEVLAHCYWKAEVDANDVEFVLAPPTTRHYYSLSPTPAFWVLGQKLTICMLDFDSVHHMVQDVGDIAQAARAFWRNDPYFPRPYFNGRTDSDRRLWKLFRDHFL